MDRTALLFLAASLTLAGCTSVDGPDETRVDDPVPGTTEGGQRGGQVTGSVQVVGGPSNNSTSEENATPGG